MKNVLYFIPLLALISAYILYRHNGKREFLKFDLVQFFYAFILTPVIFIWGKSAIFVVLKDQLDLALSNTQLFIIDSAFSVIFMYVFAFVVIHSLTKTFSLRRSRDPLYDMIEHSDFFHQNFSHLAIYSGGMAIITFVSMTNLAIPMQVEHSEAIFNGVLALGAFTALLSVAGFWLYEFWLYENSSVNFMRLVKLILGLFFLLHSVTYFLADPSFSLKYGVYWFSFSFFLTAVALSVFAERREEPATSVIQLPFRLNFNKWRHYVRYLKKQLRRLYGST